MSRRELGPIPVSGAWTPNDPVAFRKFAHLGPLRLENGSFLPEVTLAYETLGTLNEDRSNAILVLHALTGDAHISGPAAPGQLTAGWWEEAVGPGKPLDPERYFLVVPNVLGGCQGSTGPASAAPDGQPWGSRFPVISTRDQVQAEARLADYLGIPTWNTVIGASLGGHRALEWGVSFPLRCERLVVVASAACTNAERAAWAHTQIRAIELDPNWRGGDYYDQEEGPHAGLNLARQIAHATYRSPEELDARFGRAPQDREDVLSGGRLAVQSYLDYHGAKLVRRFDAGSYVSLCRTMLSYDIGRDRGGITEALRQITARTLVISVDSDRLFFAKEGLKVAEGIPGAQYACLSSPHGHDGFLIEYEQLNRVLEDFLENQPSFIDSSAL